MEITCKKCSALFRALVDLPLAGPVRVACPACRQQVTLRPAPSTQVVPPPRPAAKRRDAIIVDEPRPFRAFLGAQLQKLGFEVTLFETGEPALEFVRRTSAALVIVNVYLKGSRLGVDLCEDIKNDPKLAGTRVVLIGALFRANRFRANPTNLYGADEYIEEQIPEKEFRQIIRKLFPEVGPTVERPAESHEHEEARRRTSSSTTPPRSTGASATARSSTFWNGRSPKGASTSTPASI
jgi:CheY-like chemotaxis protein